ncbi:MAG TPA: phage GP46 family protein [Gaiellaceae bacterium]|nr:phage GP46 family protein [Gaiellaceae bacterium]
MPILDRIVDAVSGDFSPAPRGAFVTDDVLKNKIALSFRVPLGSWEGAPYLGHRFGELARDKMLAETPLRVRDLARAAVAWLVASGELDHVDVTVEQQGPQRIAFEVDCYAPGRPPFDLGPFFVVVGGGA